MFRIVRLGLNNIMLVHYFLLTIVARQQAGAGPQHNAPATRSHGCLEFDSVLWPPRCGNEAMLSHTIRSAMRERLQASGTPPGWRYNLSTHGCTLQFDVAIGDSHACQMKVDICRQQQIIHAFRQTVQLQDGLPSTKAGYYRPFWDGMSVKHWSARNGTARASPCSNAASAPRDCTLQTGHNRDWLNRSPAMFTQRASKGDRSVRSEAPLFKKCAVVGGAPTLKMSGMGAQIDAHDAVFRFNDHQTNGSFRNDVGSKTTVHIMQNAQSVTKSVHKKKRGNSRSDRVRECKFACVGSQRRFQGPRDKTPYFIARLFASVSSNIRRSRWLWTLRGVAEPNAVRRTADTLRFFGCGHGPDTGVCALLSRRTRRENVAFVQYAACCPLASRAGESRICSFCKSQQ